MSIQERRYSRRDFLKLGSFALASIELATLIKNGSRAETENLEGPKLREGLIIGPEFDIYPQKGFSKRIFPINDFQSVCYQTYEDSSRMTFSVLGLAPSGPEVTVGFPVEIRSNNPNQYKLRCPSIASDGKGNLLMIIERELPGSDYDWSAPYHNCELRRFIIRDNRLVQQGDLLEFGGSPDNWFYVDVDKIQFTGTEEGKKRFTKSSLLIKRNREKLVRYHHILMDTEGNLNIRDIDVQQPPGEFFYPIRSLYLGDNRMFVVADKSFGTIDLLDGRIIFHSLFPDDWVRSDEGFYGMESDFPSNPVFLGNKVVFAFTGNAENSNNGKICLVEFNPESGQSLFTGFGNLSLSPVFGNLEISKVSETDLVIGFANNYRDIPYKDADFNVGQIRKVSSGEWQIMEVKRIVQRTWIGFVSAISGKIGNKVIACFNDDILSRAKGKLVTPDIFLPTSTPTITPSETPNPTPTRTPTPTNTPTPSPTPKPESKVFILVLFNGFNN